MEETKVIRSINFAFYKERPFYFFTGNGISDEYHVIRHVMNLEAVNTYEGNCIFWAYPLRV